MHPTATIVAVIEPLVLTTVLVRVLQAGHALAFTPDALVWHHHRADLPSLRRHVYGYGTGLSAFLAKHLADPATRTEVLRRIPRGLARLAAVPATTSRSLGERPPVRPGGLLLREFAGMAAGPARYVRARRAVSPSRIDVTGRDQAGGARATSGEGVPCG